MKRSNRKIAIQILLLTAGLVLLLTGISVYTYHDKLSKTPVAEHIFSKRVEQHRALVTKYAKEYDVEEYVDVLLAMMMQESGGRGDDPMQSSESLCGEVGCIQEPEDSIEQGVAYFSKILNKADGDVELTVQAYNFGIGFVGYVQENGKSFNQDIAIEFSKKMYNKAEDKSKYTCLRHEAKEYDACYGDIYYSRDVMAYKQRFSRAE